MATIKLSAYMKEKGKKIMRKAEKAVDILLVLTLAVFLVTGCGDSPSKAQKERDTLIVVVTGNLPTLDPYASSTSSNVNNLNLVYETLMRYDDDGETKPLLTTGWKRSDDLN